VVAIVIIVIVVVVARCAVAIIVDFVARRVVAIDVIVVGACRNQTKYVAPSPSSLSSSVATAVIVAIIVNFVARRAIAILIDCRYPSCRCHHRCPSRHRRRRSSSLSVVVVVTCRHRPHVRRHPPLSSLPSSLYPVVISTRATAHRAVAICSALLELPRL